MTNLSNEKKLQIIPEVFFPSAPITNRSYFYGRYNQVKKIENAILEKGQHIVIYGERGIGKTSISNIIDPKNTYIIKITCNRRNTYDSLWRETLKKLQLMLKFEPLNENDQALLKFIDPILTEPLIETESIIYLMNKLKNRTLVILDEFDVIEDENTLYNFADNIKSFSDNCPNITLVFVGIAENVNELLGEHPSLERCICQVHIPRMNEQELSDIVSSAMMRLQMKIDPSVAKDIIDFSQGFPHYVHLLGKYCCLSAIEKRYDTILRANFDEAINDAIDNIYESIRSTYQKAVSSNKDNTLYSYVIFAAAMIKNDEEETFKATDLIPQFFKLLSKQMKVHSFGYHLAKLSSEDRGGIFQTIKIGKITRYKFKNPIIKAYVLLLLYQKGYLRKGGK